MMVLLLLAHPRWKIVNKHCYMPYDISIIVPNRLNPSFAKAKCIFQGSTANDGCMLPKFFLASPYVTCLNTPFFIGVWSCQNIYHATFVIVNSNFSYGAIGNCHNIFSRNIFSLIKELWTFHLIIMHLSYLSFVKCSHMYNIQLFKHITIFSQWKPNSS